jgi:hypothetical protein
MITFEAIFLVVIGFMLIGGTVFGVPTWFIGKLTGNLTSIRRMTSIGALWGGGLTTTFFLWRWGNGPPFGGGGPGFSAITSWAHNATLILVWAIFGAAVGAGTGAVVVNCQRRGILGWGIAGTMLGLIVVFVVILSLL